MKKAISYMRGQRVFTHAFSKTTAGVWILESPVFAADATDSDGLGEQITLALQASKEGVPHPTSWKVIFDPVLKLAGVKTWATFVKTSRCVEIELLSGRVSFISTENIGHDGGFSAAVRSDFPVQLMNVHTFGTNLITAFDKSR